MDVHARHQVGQLRGQPRVVVGTGSPDRDEQRDRAVAVDAAGHHERAALPRQRAQLGECVLDCVLRGQHRAADRDQLAR
jgi:hypothetical protein